MQVTGATFVVSPWEILLTMLFRMLENTSFIEVAPLNSEKRIVIIYMLPKETFEG